MALADWGIRVAGLGSRARPAALASKRPPAGALQDPVFNNIPGQPMWTQYEGPNQVKLYGRNIYATRAIEFIADNISALPFLCGNYKSKTPRPTSAMQQLLGPMPGNPNPLWSAADMWKYSIIQYLVLGKIAWLNERDDSGRIVALWPLMAQHLIPETAGIQGKSYFKGYRYGTQGAFGYREFGLKDITYIWRPSQKDLREPESPLQLTKYAIDVARLIDQFDNAFLSNGGVPTHLVVTPAFDSPASSRAFRDQFSRKFGGASNAGKPMFAEYTTEPGDTGGAQSQKTVSVEVIGQSQKDSQLHELRKDKIQDILVGIGIALSLLGYSGDAKYTNMESDRKNAWQGRMGPIAAELASRVNTVLGPEMDNPADVGWFDTSGVPELRQAPVFTETEGIAAVAARLITPDEYRHDRGMPPLPDGQGEKLVAKPKPVTPRLPAADPEPVDPETAQTKPKAPPVKARAVRTDLLDVLRGQLELELAAQRLELEMRRDGKRGGRNRARAAVSLAEVYDVEHWRGRLARNLAPAARAAGLSDGEVTNWSEDITGAVFDQLADGSLEVFDEPGPFMQMLDHAHVQPRVQLDTLETQLLQIQAGYLSADDAIAGLTGAA
jgi:HK97 family phage portal protein